MTTLVEPRSRGWIAAIVLVWLLAAAALTIFRLPEIAALDLPDTDDAQRLAQVRDWLGGQAWGDVDQHRMNPPASANMHWSRLVDLPIAGTIVVAEPVFGRAVAERIAVTAAPLLALLIAMLLAGVAAGRATNRAGAAIFGAFFLLSASALLPLFAPLRIDHHGWQLALLLGLVAALMDRQSRFRSGFAAGIFAVAAIAIGLETLPYIIVASGVLAIAWALDGRRSRLLRGYGLALASVTPFAYAAFVPSGRWTLAACDALSPVYAMALIPAGILALFLPVLVGRRGAGWRLGAVVIGFGAIALATAHAFPQCARGPLGDLDPRIVAVLARISEARPLLSYLADTPLNVVHYGLYPLVGIVAALIIYRGAEPGQRFGPVLLLSLLMAASALMLVQIRASYVANMFAAVACGAAVAQLLPPVRAMSAMLPRMTATAALLIGFSGAFPVFVSLAVKSAGLVAEKAPDAAASAADGSLEAAKCNDKIVLEPLTALPAGTIANVVDMGPALLVHTSHGVVAGPYHRNPDMISDAMRIWRAGDTEARGIAARYGAGYLLGCTRANDLDSALAEAPAGLWARLEDAKTPAWLEPLPVPEGSPLRLYRIKG